MPRNSSGNYTLPIGNPVVTGTTITSTWANSTMADLVSEITNSLDRQGRGGMLAPFKVSDGSPAAPGVSFTNEPSTGWYRPSAGTIGVSVLGANVATITNTGANMLVPFRAADGVVGSPGIGFTNENNTGIFRKSSGVMAFTVLGTEVGTIGATGLTMPLNITNLAYTGTLTGGTGVVNLGSGQFYKDASGNVGIGTAAPTQKLQLQGATSSNTYARWTNGTQDFIAGISSANSVLLGTLSNDAFAFFTNGAERMRIDAAGYVYVNGAQGLGVTGAFRHQVNGSYLAYGDGNGFRALNSTANGAVSLTAVAGASGGGRLDSEAGPLLFNTAGSERMRIDASGDVGIGGASSRLGGARTLFITPPDPATQDSELHIRSSGAFLRTNTTKAVPGGLGAYQHFQNGVLQFSVGNFAGGTGVLEFRTGVSNIERAAIDGNGVFTYGGLEVGYRDVPVRVVNGNTTLLHSDRGKHVAQTAVGAVITVPQLLAGSCITVMNSAPGSITLSPSGVDIWLAGTQLTGSRTVVSRGLVTLLWLAADTVAVSGAGVS